MVQMLKTQAGGASGRELGGWQGEGTEGRGVTMAPSLRTLGQKASACGLREERRGDGRGGAEEDGTGYRRQGRARSEMEISLPLCRLWGPVRIH